MDKKLFKQLNEIDSAIYSGMDGEGFMALVKSYIDSTDDTHDYIKDLYESLNSEIEKFIKEGEYNINNEADSKAIEAYTNIIVGKAITDVGEKVMELGYHMALDGRIHRTGYLSSDNEFVTTNKELENLITMVKQAKEYGFDLSWDNIEEKGAKDSFELIKDGKVIETYQNINFGSDVPIGKGSTISK